MSGRLLGVNIDHVATLRQVRGTSYPDLAGAVAEAEQGGADFITAHLREDRRHIQDADVGVVMRACSTWLNLEIAAEADMLAIACESKPRSVCLVPERREELTTEGGLNVAHDLPRMRDAVAMLRGSGIEVSLFIEPDLAQVKCSVKSGADAVELHTGRYAQIAAHGGGPDLEKELARLSAAAGEACSAGLKVNAGHGLTLANAGRVAQFEVLSEFNIGHSIVADALFCGLRESVARMRRAVGL